MSNESYNELQDGSWSYPLTSKAVQKRIPNAVAEEVKKLSTTNPELFSGLNASQVEDLVDEKLTNIGDVNVSVDASLSEESEKPISNKAVATAIKSLEGKDDELSDSIDEINDALSGIGDEVSNLFDAVGQIQYLTVETYDLIPDCAQFEQGVYVCLVKQDSNYPKTEDENYSTIYLCLTDSTPEWEFVGKLNVSERALAGIITSQITSSLNNYYTKTEADGKYIASTNKSSYDEAANKAHEHSNKSVIDKLSESNGKLAYNGSVIASGSSSSSSDNGNASSWYGTRAEWEALDKENLADGQIICITDDENSTQVVNVADTQEIYSTDEVVIGTWVDGKPLYRKTFDTHLPAKNNEYVKLVDGTELADIDSVCHIRGISKNAAYGEIYHLPHYNSVFQIDIYYNCDSEYKGIWGIMSGSGSYLGDRCWITIEYTKTTDTF